jgi:transposase
VARKPTKEPENSKRQRFTPEYKLEAVRLSEEGTKSIAAVAADLGIAANQLHRWRRQHADRGLAAFPGNGKINSHDEELHRLRRDLRQVTEERDFLKNRPRAWARPMWIETGSRLHRRAAHFVFRLQHVARPGVS